MPLSKTKRKFLGRFLRACREKNGLSVRGVGRKIGISFSNYASIERGEITKIKVKTLKNISRLYGIEGDGLFIMAERIPEDVFYKIIRHPYLLTIVREYQG